MITRRRGAPARPGDDLGAPPPRLPQMPAYHLVRADGSGITMVNIGVGPANAKTITDHIAVLRPHAWIMLGHCAGLRNTQQLGDYVLAHGYVREDHVLDEDLPLWVPIPALAEVQVALESAVAEVTQLKGYELKRDHAHRHGREHRQPQLGAAAVAPRASTPERRFSQSRAIALDMESATIAANGFRFRVPYGTLLCVSDKPLHGEIKLPGMANHFYRERVDQHLRIGIRAIELLREAGRRPAAQPQAAQLRRGGVPVAGGIGAAGARSGNRMSTTFAVGRTDLRRTAWLETAATALAPGQVRLTIDRFALTSNNITYGAFGAAMHYWDFFPSGDAELGCIPVWGFATVSESRAEGVAVGERFYGYWPMADEVVLGPVRGGKSGFVDEAAHRSALPGAYNHYLRCSSDPLYRPDQEALIALLRPLFITSFLIDDFLADNDFFGARTAPDLERIEQDRVRPRLLPGAAPRCREHADDDRPDFAGQRRLHALARLLRPDGSVPRHRQRRHRHARGLRRHERRRGGPRDRSWPLAGPARLQLLGRRHALGSARRRQGPAGTAPGALLRADADQEARRRRTRHARRGRGLGAVRRPRRRWRSSLASCRRDARSRRRPRHLPGAARRPRSRQRRPDPESCEPRHRPPRPQSPRRDADMPVAATRLEVR